MNFVKFEISEMWIVWKLGISICEFLDKIWILPQRTHSRMKNKIYILPQLCNNTLKNGLIPYLALQTTFSQGVEAVFLWLTNPLLQKKEALSRLSKLKPLLLFSATHFTIKNRGTPLFYVHCIIQARSVAARKEAEKKHRSYSTGWPKMVGIN